MVTKDPDPARGSPSTAPESESLTPLRWPPPGLARLQGDAYGAGARLAAGAVLILPLLYAMVARQDPWSLGPLGDSLWLAFLFGIIGIPVLLSGYIALARLLRRASDAVDQGHDWRVVALVATDHRRDTGFLLQGARAYRLLSPATRKRIARVRMIVGGLALFAALWLSLGFGISVVLGARGVLGPWGVVAGTLGPSVVTAATAVLLFGWEEGKLRKSRKRWFRQSWSQELVREEIRRWQAAMSERAPGLVRPEGAPEGGGRARTTLRTSYVGVGVATIMAFVPLFTLIFSAAIIPILARISVPELDRSVQRFAATEPLRSYALAPDSALTPRAAGAILHTLSFVGRPYRATEGVLPPERTYPDPWFPDGDPTGPPSQEQIQAIIDGMGRPLPPDQRAYLDSVAAHPAHAEMSRLARAGVMDISAVRWSMPLPSDITLSQLSMPAMGTLRQAAYAHLARAAVQASRGRVAAADTTIREVLSIGLLMADESPTILDNLIGMAMAELAGDALISLYRNTGHPQADALAWGIRSAERSVERAPSTAITDVAARLRAMPDNALDSAFLRGARWEYVGLLNTVGPCINLRRVVFGPDIEYRSWLDRVEDRLVRYPGEAELFAVARGGLLGGDPDQALSLSGRVLALTMGDADRPGSCARILGEVVGF
ncbi:MAG: hypothetical protein R6U63_13945 [Longimicrobiales bacterium]